MGEIVGLESLCDLKVISARLKKLNHNKWWLGAHGKPKLRMYFKSHDTTTTQSIID